MEEENVRELRSSRSRSNTPFIGPSHDRESVHGSEEGKRVSTSGHAKGRQKVGGRLKSNLATVTESHTSEVTVRSQRRVNRRTGNESDSSTERAVEDDHKSGRRSDRQKNRRRVVANGTMTKKEDEEVASASEKMKEEKVHKRQLQKTSDYSSEEGEGAAFQIYKRAGEWWNKFPKTDYTYSRISPHRKELVPGVIAMPNMSRRSLNTMRQHGISSSESNLTRSNTFTATTKHQKSKSRWIDPSTSASRKVFEEWTAVDSDVDEVAESFARKSSSTVQKSWAITTYVSSFFMTIWTFISSSCTSMVDSAYRLVGYPRDNYVYATPRRGVSPVTDGGPNLLKRLFSWCYRVGCSVMQLDLMLLSSCHSTQIDQENEMYYEDEFAETETMSKTASPHKHRSWRLLLLLLPLLFLAGWWFMPEEKEVTLNALMPLTETMATVQNAVIGWIFIPVHAFGALKEKLFMGTSSSALPLIVSSDSQDEQKQTSVDMETLAQYILASSQFEQHLSSKINAQAETASQDRDRLQTAINQQSQFHQENTKLLEENRILLSELTEKLKHLQQKVEHVDDANAKTQAQGKEWERNWEKEKLSLREEITTTSVRDGDQEQQSQIMRRCCQRGSAPTMVHGNVIEQHVLKVLADLLGATGGQYSGNPEDLRTWVGNMILAREDLEARLANLTITMDQHTRDAVRRSKEVIMATVKEHIQNEFAKWHDQQRQHEVRAIVDEALSKYDADKTGGSIISTRCTETYHAKTAKLSLLGIPLWYHSNTPRTVIQGLKDEQDVEPVFLGRYTYRQNSTSLQNFSVQRADVEPFELVELRIESNHGNMEYTCLYRFRVHGTLVSK
ncbi:hypothetical protein C0J52_17659 [Blattella germanica]|nr:hypothetical protein C0J52_17659 [Blattella germanica]